jgi:hypoxanthine phosphoribosyltransferase
MYKDNWRPDYIVGLTRGGLVPAVYMSHMLDIPMETLKVALRDGEGGESNCWMAEDAFGYIPSDMREGIDKRSDATYKKNILIVDDINDSGATINWIMHDWPSGCLPSDPDWQYAWGNNVRYAVLVDNLSSQAELSPSYTGHIINKVEEDVWVDFPWESWWEK